MRTPSEQVSLGLARFQGGVHLCRELVLCLGYLLLPLRKLHYQIPQVGKADIFLANLAAHVKLGLAGVDKGRRRCGLPVPTGLPPRLLVLRTLPGCLDEGSEDSSPDLSPADALVCVREGVAHLCETALVKHKDVHVGQGARESALDDRVGDEEDVVHPPDVTAVEDAAPGGSNATAHDDESLRCQHDLVGAVRVWTKSSHKI
mmetsp:Transcript_35596/g.80406  ORF Transcript_35596/g.80406 Transcript_35596/m.80406 type:complete len:203 (+) Transcript_35596:159-767(+)